MDKKLILIIVGLFVLCVVCCGVSGFVGWKYIQDNKGQFEELFSTSSSSNYSISSLSSSSKVSAVADSPLVNDGVFVDEGLNFTASYDNSLWDKVYQNGAPGLAITKDGSMNVGMSFMTFEGTNVDQAIGEIKASIQDQGLDALEEGTREISGRSVKYLKGKVTDPAAGVMIIHQYYIDLPSGLLLMITAGYDEEYTDGFKEVGKVLDTLKLTK